MKLEKLIIEQITVPERVQLPDESKQIQSALIAQSRERSRNAITSPEHAGAVGEAARDIRTFVKSVRDVGLGLRRPLKQLQDQIKRIEDDYCGPLEVEQTRLECLIGEWNDQERKRVEEEERRRQAELERIERERRDAEERARAEIVRQQREAAEAEAKARAAEAGIQNEAELAAAIEAEQKRREEANQRELDAIMDAEKVRMDAELARRTAIAQPLPEARKVTGAATRRVVKWIVTDESALLRARPELFKIEVKASAINAICKPNRLDSSKENPDKSSIPGLTLWYEMETSIRKW